MSKANQDYKERFKQLIEKHPILEKIIQNTRYHIVNIKTEDKEPLVASNFNPYGIAAEKFSEYIFWTNSYKYGKISVYENVFGRADEIENKDGLQCSLVVYFNEC